MRNVVLDSTALLALLQNQQGAEAVRGCIGGLVISALTLEEVLSSLANNGIPLDEAIALLKQMELECIPFDLDQAGIAASLKSRLGSGHFSQAGRACLALAKSRGLPVLTGDPEWLAVDIGVTVEAIR